MLELNYQISLVIIQVEDLKSKLAIHKTEPNQRNKDTKAPIAQTGQQGKRHQEEPCWVLRQRQLLRETGNVQALIMFKATVS